MSDPKPDKPDKQTITAIPEVIAVVDKFIADRFTSDTPELRDEMAVVTEKAYDEGYHDARSHYNIDNPDPPAIKRF